MRSGWQGILNNFSFVEKCRKSSNLFWFENNSYFSWSDGISDDANVPVSKKLTDAEVLFCL